MTIVSTAVGAQTLVAGEVLYLTSSGSITSPGLVGIGSFAADVGAVIAGSVIAGQGVIFIHADLPSADFLDVTATGSILGTDYGVGIGDNTSFDLENDGSVSGGKWALFLENSSGTGADTIRNFGTMHGGLAAIHVDPGFAYANEIDIVNDGVMFGGTMALDLAGATSHVSLANAGMIHGDVVTGAGDDSVINSGRIQGRISTNAGSDLVDTSEGLTRRVSIDLGAGDDLATLGAGHEFVSGGAGTDVVSYYLSTAIVLNLLHPSLNRGDAAGDSFAGIEEFQGSDQGDDRMTGRAGAEVLSGLQGDDSLSGGAGADTLAGGLGADRLTGGSGDDSFVFHAADEGGDRITDFARGTGNHDHVVFSAAGFSLDLPEGALDASHFAARADNAAQTGDAWFVFRTTDHSLWFDADGKGAGAAVLIATFAPLVTLSAADIVIAL